MTEAERSLDIKTLAKGPPRRRPRGARARAITLIESRRADHQAPRASWCRSAAR